MRRNRCDIRLLMVLALLGGGAARVHADTFVVSTSVDSVSGSLREAIAAANAAPGADEIVFNLPAPSGPGPTFIWLDGPMPTITGDVTILGPGADRLVLATPEARAPFNFFTIAAGLTVRVEGLEFLRAGGIDGGAFAVRDAGSLTIVGCRFRQCVVSGGGGALSLAGAGDVALTIINSTFLECSAGVEGGAVRVRRTSGRASVMLQGATFDKSSVMSAQPGRLGGGLFIAGGDGPHTLDIISSTLLGNTVPPTGTGGAVHIDALGGSVTIDNSTFAGNVAEDGAVLDARGAQVLLRHCTITQNTLVGSLVPVAAKSVLRVVGGPTPTVRGTILSGNASGPAFRDLADAQPVTGNNNLIGTGGGFVHGVDGNIVGVNDPRLAPMGDLGGPTPTFSLRPDSPALDAGSPTDAPPVDQRGQPRPADGNFDFVSIPDIGAFETSQFIVSNLGNAGPGSLRQAITDNNLAGGGFVRFRINAAGTIRRIALASALPPVNRRVFIDGWSQIGTSYVGPPVVELDGGNVVGTGLELRGPDSIVRGLAINAFRAPDPAAQPDPGLDGIGLSIRTATGIRVWVYGCWFGLAPDGVTPKPNHQAGVAIFSGANASVIGTNADGVNDAAEGNVIVGSVLAGVRAGVYIQSNSNAVCGNLIGVSRDGVTPMPNATGVWVDRLAANNRVGVGLGIAVPAAARNVISGNLGTGVLVSTGTGAGNSVGGNIIGLTALGDAVLPNTDGIVVDNATTTTVGGGVPGAGNIVAGNRGDGVRIAGPDSAGSVVQQNIIGLGPDGRTPRPNAGHGLVIEGGAAFTRVGTLGDQSPADTRRGNTIAASTVRGVVVRGAATTNVSISGNIVGLTADTLTAVPNTLGGIIIDDAPAARVGGPGLQQNIIAGNAGPGIEITGAGATDTVIVNNRIGVNAADTALGNTGPGVLIAGGATGATIGGLTPSDANVIARNAAGVIVVDNGTRGHAILGNVIADNLGLGIDLADDGVTPNGPVGVVRAGPNNLQNAPVIRSVSSSGVITAALEALPSTTYRVEFFESATPDPSGFGEGARWIGAVTVSTDSTGRTGDFVFTKAPEQTHPFITATATDAASASRSIPGASTQALGTSEFARAVGVNTAPLASPSLASGVEDSDVVVTLTGVDADPDAVLRARVASLPARGALLQFGSLAPVAAGELLTDTQNRVVFRPPANAFGAAVGAFTFSVTDGADESEPSAAAIDLAPVADTPSITNAVTTQGRQTSDGLVISRSPVDGPEVTHYRLVAVSGGAAFEPDGVTPVPVGGFVTAANGALGLRFTPAPGFVGTGTLSVRAATAPTDSALGGDIATAQILVGQAALPPSVTGVTTLEDTLSTAGVIITRNAGNGPEVSHFKIATLSSGQLLLADGVTPVAVGQFITAAQAAAGLRYRPAPDFNGPVSLSVAASIGATDAGIDNPPTGATITVTPVNDAPTAIASDPPAVNEDASQVVLVNWASMTPGPANESSQTALEYQVAGLTNAALFAEAPFVSPAGTLAYRPAANASGVATFQLRVRDSGGTADGGVDLSAPVTITVRVNPVNDPPAFDAFDPPAVLEGSGPIAVPAWVTAFNPGEPGEQSQTAAAYLVDQVSNSALFTVPPAVAPDGRLTYSVASSGFGVATFRVRVRDSGGTANGGIDLSAARTFSIIVRPTAVCRDVVIDARTACVSRIVPIDQINRTPNQPGPGASASITSSVDLSRELPIGETPVRITVTYSDGLSSTCFARVTVLAGDCNRNGLPDSCDVAAGLGTDCNLDGLLDSCACYWTNGDAPDPAAGSDVDGQLSHLGGGVPTGAKVADDFYLLPGAIHRIFGFTGSMLTNSLPSVRKARLEFYEDCDGMPGPLPIRTFTASTIVSTVPAAAGFDLVTYSFSFCSDPLYLEGGRSYWVSLIGVTDGQGADSSYWAATSPPGVPGAVIGAPPKKTIGLPSSSWPNFQYEPWQSVGECCIGCVNFAFKLAGEACPLVWDNGKAAPPSVGEGANVVPAGTMSGANAGMHPQPRAADNFLIKPCTTAEICYIEAVVYTNCDPVQGFIEIYDNLCRLPAGTPLYSARVTRSEPIGRSVIIDGVELPGQRLILTGVNWSLVGGKDYWLSAGAISGDVLNTRSYFARAADCKRTCSVRISPGARLDFTRPVGEQWVETGIDYAFRIFRRPDAPALGSPGPGGGTGSVPGCATDFNGDGLLTTQDVFEFLARYFTACP